MSYDIKRIQPADFKEEDCMELMCVGTMPDGSFMNIIRKDVADFISNKLGAKIVGGLSPVTVLQDAWVSLTLSLARAMSETTGHSNVTAINSLQLSLAERLLKDYIKEGSAECDPFTPNEKMH